MGAIGLDFQSQNRQAGLWQSNAARTLGITAGRPVDAVSNPGDS